MARPERRVDPAGGPVQALAAELRALRRRAGNPGYRELAQRAGFSPATLANATGGRRLPTWAVTHGLVRACGDDPRRWEARWRQVSAQVTAARPAPNGNGSGQRIGAGSPFLGLVSYGSADADWFFGRDRAVARLVELLRQQRFVAVFGASGSGKSSLLRAGLVPRLTAAASGQPGRGLVPVEMTPGSSPVKALRQTLRPVLAGVSPVPVLLVVDQFEELFTLCQDPAERVAFVTELACLAGNPAGLTRLSAAADGDEAQDRGEPGEPASRVVIGVRADFYERCVQLPVLAELLAGANVPVPAMTSEELRAVVTEPARRAGASVERALIATILAEAAGRPGALPLVSHALLQAWRHRRSNVLTLADYEAVGGIGGSVAWTAEATYRLFTERQAASARQILTRLVTLGEGVDDTRRRVDRSELDFPEVDAVLERLAAARLIVVNHDSVEIAHEALIAAWPRLHGWLNADREMLRRHRRLTDASHVWLAHDRDPGALYRGAVLDTWDDQSVHGLNTFERDFLAASRDHRARRNKRRRRRLQAAFAFVTTAAVLSTTLAVVAATQSRQAAHERDRAVATRLVADARAEMPGDIRRALRSALAAVRTQPDPQAIAMLRRATANAGMYVPKSGAHPSLLGVAVSGVNSRLATTSAGGEVQVWAWSKGRPLNGGPMRLTGHRGPARCPALTQDGHVVTAGDDGTVRAWDTTTAGHAPTVLRGHHGRVHCVAVAADSRTIASAGADGTVRIWNLARPGAATSVLRGHVGPVLGVAVSPDGRLAASAGKDGTVRLWHLDGATAPRLLHAGSGVIHAVAFNRDGGLAAGGEDGLIRYWTAPATGRPVALEDPSAVAERRSVRSVAFSDDGQLMVTASASGHVLTWHRSNGYRKPKFHGMPWYVAAPVVDGDHLVSLGKDATIVSWHMGTGVGVNVRQTASAAWLEPLDVGRRTWHTDADTLLPWPVDNTPTWAPGHAVIHGGTGTVATWDGQAQIRVRTRAKRLREIVLPASDPAHLTFSPDGRSLLVVNADDALRGEATLTIMNLAVPQAQSARYSRSLPFAAALSPEGRVAVPGDGGRWIEILDQPSRPAARLAGHTAPVQALAFAADGMLVSASVDGVKTWDVTGRRELRHWRIPPGVEISALAVSADSGRVAAASSDGTIRIWHRDRNATPITLSGHHGSIHKLAFAARTQHLVSAGADGTVRVWPNEHTKPVIFNGFENTIAVTVSPDGQKISVTHQVSGSMVVTTWRCPECTPSTTALTQLAETRLAAMGLAQ